MTDKRGQEFRIQHERRSTGATVILVAPNEEASGKPLERTAGCRRSSWDEAVGPELARAPRISAIAEAPPGWYRDDQGRVFQVSFDLMRRFRVGAGWQPTSDLRSGDVQLQRAYVDMGLEASWLDSNSRIRHTLGALQGTATFDDLRAEGTLLSYEMVRASTTPLLRITTFFGTPKRYDTKMDMGLGFKLFHLDYRPHGAADISDLELGEAHLAWYPWHSDDLFNYVRFTAGATGGDVLRSEDRRTESYYVGPQAALQAFFNVDRDGFHYISAGARAAAPNIVDGPGKGDTHIRAGADASYEVIFLAVNDQPLSLHVRAAVDWRDDLPDTVPDVEGSLMTGVRFSFWAPARDRTALREPYIRRAMNDTGSF